MNPSDFPYMHLVITPGLKVLGTCTCAAHELLGVICAPSTVWTRWTAAVPMEATKVSDIDPSLFKPTSVYASHRPLRHHRTNSWFHDRTPAGKDIIKSNDGSQDNVAKQGCCLWDWSPPHLNQSLLSTSLCAARVSTCDEEARRPRYIERGITV